MAIKFVIKGNTLSIYIKIRRIDKKEECKIYYEVLTQDFGGAHFYFCIDQENKKLLFFIKSDFSTVIKTIELLQLDKPLGFLDDIDQKIYTRVVMKAIKTFQENSFPGSSITVHKLKGVAWQVFNCIIGKNYDYN